MKTLSIVILSVAIFMIALPIQVQAVQFDAPYYEFAKKNKTKWVEEDKEINKKLKALEKKFGKKPNIIYIDIESKKLELKKNYVKKLRQVLPPKKVMRYFQMENKMEAGYNHELAVNIPLVK